MNTIFHITEFRAMVFIPTLNSHILVFSFFSCWSGPERTQELFVLLLSSFSSSFSTLSNIRFPHTCALTQSWIRFYNAFSNVSHYLKSPSRREDRVRYELTRLHYNWDLQLDKRRRTSWWKPRDPTQKKIQESGNIRHIIYHAFLAYMCLLWRQEYFSQSWRNNATACGIAKRW